VAWHERNRPHTCAYDDYLMRCLIHSTIADVSRKQQVGYDAVEGSLKRRIEAEVDWSAIEYIGTLGMDEIALRKGKRDFVLVITARHEGQIRILAVLPDRKKATARQFFETIPDTLHATNEAVCSDMWEGYINAAKAFRQAHETVQFDVVVDRFHSGFVEGLNNKIKTIKQRCYGLTDIQRVFQHIYLDLEGFRLFA
jgi:transposase